LKGLKEPNDDNSINGYDGIDGISYGFFLINTNESSCYLNSIHCEINLDNGTDNQWNNTFYGNYWSYYNGNDEDGDKIGDVPYNLNGSAHSKDYLPLMNWSMIWIKPLRFILAYNTQYSIYDGNFNLIWTKSQNAKNYTIYRSDKNITKINDNLKILAKGVKNFFYVENNLPVGVYYYIVVAFNDYGNRSSNCIQVIVSEKPPIDDNPLPEIITWIIIGSIFIGGLEVVSGAVVSMRKNHRKKREKYSKIKDQ